MTKLAPARRAVLALCALVVATCSARAAVLREGEGFITTAHGPVWYSVIGHGPGVPLLMLHGGPGGTSCSFEPIARRLGEHRPVIYYDQLGSGRSGRPRDLGMQTVERAVAEVAVVRRALGLPQVHLLGHSWGSGLAVAYEDALHPAGIVSMTLSGPFFSTRRWLEDAEILKRQLPPDVQATIDREEAAGTVHSAAYEAATAVFYQRFMNHRGAHPAPADCAGAPMNQALYEHLWGPTEFHATGRLRDFDVTAALPRIRVPVLLTAGRFDEARPETAASYEALIPHAELVILEDSGHSLLDEPDTYADAVEAFLERAEQRGHGRPKGVPGTPAGARSR